MADDRAMAMPEAHERAPILDPLDRNAEILFGLFMCLTFTGTLSVASAGGDDVRTMMIAAIGCNTAWGMVDAVMYILRTLVVRGRELHLVRTVRSASDPAEARAIVSSELAPLVARAIGDEGLDRIRAEIRDLSEVPAKPALKWRDVQAAIVIFVLVFLSTFPLVLPFVFIDHLHRAMRVSAAVAITMLFLCGYTWGKHAGMRPLRVGVAMVIIGVVVEGAIIALGG